MTERRRSWIAGYCRIDLQEPGEAEQLEVLCRAAEEYLASAGIGAPAEGTPRQAQYDLALGYLVLDAHDRRDATITGTIVTENPAFRRLINQLKLTEPPAAAGEQAVPDADTGGR